MQEAEKAKKVDKIPGGCGNFKAATSPKTESRNNDGGVFLATCARHGIPLAAYNIPGGMGERQFMPQLLLETIMADPSCPDKLVWTTTVPQTLMVVCHVRYSMYLRTLSTYANRLGSIQQIDICCKYIPLLWA